MKNYDAKTQIQDLELLFDGNFYVMLKIKQPNKDSEMVVYKYKNSENKFDELQASIQLKDLKNDMIRSDLKGTFYYVTSTGLDQDKLHIAKFKAGKFTTETLKIDSSNINNISIQDHLFVLSVNNLEPDSQEKLDVIQIYETSRDPKKQSAPLDVLMKQIVIPVNTATNLGKSQLDIS